MNQTSRNESGVGWLSLWFGFLGGGVAWGIHLMFAWAFAEWGGFTGFPHFGFLGINGLSWLLIALSAITIAMAAAAAWIAYKAEGRLRDERERAIDQRGSGLYMARAGWIASGLFAFVIVVQSIPIFFFLQRHST